MSGIGRLRGRRALARRAPASTLAWSGVGLLGKKDAVFVSGAKVDVDRFDFAAREREVLGVAKFAAVDGHAFVQHERRVAGLADLLELVAVDVREAGRPAAVEISAFADGVVVGAGEGEIVGQ